jgi:7,8-dihydropterin-6-yl-methyl-4-(beta-D-ribofuranosyl)aminobenzene 5'-phosphate synthase
MERLGVRPDDLSGVFISHAHLDHVGGMAQMRQKTFALSTEPVDLHGIPAFVPEPMTHPTAAVEIVTGPRKLAEGMASTGPLARAIWLMGTCYEHALLVNVRDKGVVMIVGCGHPSLERLLERAQAVVDSPLYGVVGGLHFPVTASRAGKGAQIILGNGKLPWQRITRRETMGAASRLAALHPGLVALSAHDSCDWTLSVFRETFGERCRDVKVGREIVVA